MTRSSRTLVIVIIVGSHPMNKVYHKIDTLQPVCYKYPMKKTHTFADYWAGLTPERKQALAERSGISYKRLSNLANGHTRAGLAAVTALGAIDKKLTLAVLRPDLVGKVSGL